MTSRDIAERRENRIGIVGVVRKLPAHRGMLDRQSCAHLSPGLAVIFAAIDAAVDPARDLAKYIGETTAWHSDERFFFRPEFIAELRAIAPQRLTRMARYHAVIAKGDEVLSWVEMTGRYVGCDLELIEGGDHAISDFERYLPGVMAFFGLTR